MQEVIELLKQLEETRFFGKITLDFQNGELILIRKEQTIKPKGTTQYASSKY